MPQMTAENSKKKQMTDGKLEEIFIPSDQKWPLRKSYLIFQFMEITTTDSAY